MWGGRLLMYLNVNVCLNINTSHAPIIKNLITPQKDSRFYHGMLLHIL